MNGFCATERHLQNNLMSSSILYHDLWYTTTCCPVRAATLKTKRTRLSYGWFNLEKNQQNIVTGSFGFDNIFDRRDVLLMEVF